MNDIFVNSEQSLVLYEDFKKKYVSINEILDGYETLKETIHSLEEENFDLKRTIRELDSNYDI